MNKVFTQRAEDGSVVIIPDNLVRAMLDNPAYMKQYVAQVCMAEAAQAAQAAKRTYTAEDLKVQHQPIRLLPVYTVSVAPMATTRMAPLTPEQKAANEVIRKRQYEAQCAMRDANLASAAPKPALAA